MTTPPTSAPPALRKEDDSSAPDALSKRRDTRSTGGAGDGRYDVIYMDPPWWYNQRADTDSFRGGARRHYPLMTDECLERFGDTVDGWAATNCALAMWGTGARMDFAFRLFFEWGFRYRTWLATWVKTNADGTPVTACGHYTSQSCEVLLLAGRGSIPVAERLLPQVHFAQTTEHSEKPAIFRTLVESLWPNARRIEVFCRHAPEGWDAWGNEVGLLHGGEKQIRRWRDDGQLRLFGEDR